MKNVLRKSATVIAMSVVAVLLMMEACKKDGSASPEPLPANKQKVNIYLSDDPGYFDKVLLDIRKVEVLVDTCGGKDDENWQDRDRCWWDEDHAREQKDTCELWDSLGIKAGVYDLLTLRNGADTLLAGGTVAKGTMKRIRITIGSQNSLVKDGVTYPLKSIAGQSRIVIRVRHTEWDQLDADNLQLWLDFDVQRSIIRVWNNQFILKPYINVFTILKMGSISGKVTPAEAFPILSVYNNSNDTAYAMPWRSGEYKVRGLKVGDWSVFVNASNGYKDTTINGIKVERGKDTKIPDIRLHK